MNSLVHELLWFCMHMLLTQFRRTSNWTEALHLEKYFECQWFVWN